MKTEKVILTGAAILGTLLYLDQKAWGKALDGGSSDIIPPFYSPTDFIKLYFPLAEKYSANKQIPPEFTIAQAGIESGWGTSYKFTHFKNVFGIKTGGKSWTGATDGKGFRAYDSVEDSFADHERILQEPRYASAMDPLNASDPVAFAQIVGSIYTPDPGYTDTLIKAINIVQSKILS